MTTCRTFLLTCSFVLLVVGVQAQDRLPSRGRTEEQRSAGITGRIAAPKDLKCPRSSLTSYNGRVLSLKRRAASTTLHIRTDWDTTETVQIKHPKSRTAVERFLLNGAAFKPSDWKLIETAPNRLAPNLRANIWICDDGSNPLVDWRISAAEQR